MKERLLKRINQWATSTTSAIREPDINELMASIQDDLEKIFNTRRGTVLIDDEYGMPDFSYDAPDTGQIRSAMTEVVRKYEKRLHGIDVTDNTEKARQEGLGFIIRALLRHKDQQLPFSVNAQVRGDGSISLSQR